MSIIKCPKCSKDISDNEENCILCGYQLEEKQQEDVMNEKEEIIAKLKLNIIKILWSTIIIIAVAMFLLINYKNQTPISVSKKYIETNWNGNWTEAINYIASDSLNNTNFGKVQNNYDSPIVINYKLTKEEFKNKEAVVYLEFEAVDEDDDYIYCAKDTLYLKKIDGDWMIYNMEENE